MWSTLVSNGLVGQYGVTAFFSLITGIDDPTEELDLNVTSSMDGSALLIEYSLPISGAVSIDILDINGRLIRSLLQGQFLPSGKHVIQTNLGALANGIYLIRIQTKDEELTKKLYSGKN